MAKRVELISRKIKNLGKVKTAKSYIGKTVYSKKGEIIGKIYDIVLKKGCLAGVLVKGKRKVFIGKEFLGSESKKGMMLKIEPVTSLIGRYVYDSHGKRIGKVSDLKRKSNTNNYSGILVKKSVYRRAFEVSKKDIDVAKKTIVLKKPLEKIMKNHKKKKKKGKQNGKNKK